MLNIDYFSFQVILGKVERFPTSLDEQLQKQLLDCSGEILTATGNTMCTHDFYEGKLMFCNHFKLISPRLLLIRVTEFFLTLTIFV